MEYPAYLKLNRKSIATTIDFHNGLMLIDIDKYKTPVGIEAFSLIEETQIQELFQTITFEEAQKAEILDYFTTLNGSLRYRAIY